MTSIRSAYDVLSGREPAPSHELTQNGVTDKLWADNTAVKQKCSASRGAWIRSAQRTGSAPFARMALCNSSTTSAVTGFPATCRAQITSTTATSWAPAPTLAGPRKRRPVPPQRLVEEEEAVAYEEQGEAGIDISTLGPLQMSCRR